MVKIWELELYTLPLTRLKNSSTHFSFTFVVNGQVNEWTALCIYFAGVNKLLALEKCASC